MKMRAPIWTAVAEVLACVVLATGCIPLGGLGGFGGGPLVAFGTETTEHSFTKAQVERIQRGETIKDEILQWFGPPLAMARKGEPGEAPTANPARFDSFFEPFSERYAIGEHHVVYYYQSQRSRTVQGLMTRQSSVTDRLWILLDGRRGTVVDYVLKQDR